MTKEKIISLISELHSPLTPECQTDLLKIIQIFTAEKNEVLVREGQYSDKTFFIIQGGARAYYLKNGKDISDWFAFENDFICAVNSYFLNVPSQYFIEVSEPSVLMAFSRDDIDKLSNQYPDFERLTKIIITKTMLQLQERVTSLQFQTAEQKYEKLLSVFPNITQRMPLKHIASYIGITLETLSRIRKPKKRI